MDLKEAATLLTIIGIGIGFVVGLVRVGTILGTIQSTLKSNEVALTHQVAAMLAVERSLSIHVSDENRRFERIEELIRQKVSKNYIEKTA